MPACHRTCRHVCGPWALHGRTELVVSRSFPFARHRTHVLLLRDGRLGRLHVAAWHSLSDHVEVAEDRRFSELRCQCFIVVDLLALLSPELCLGSRIGVADFLDLDSRIVVCKVHRSVLLTEREGFLSKSGASQPASRVLLLNQHFALFGSVLFIWVYGRSGAFGSDEAPVQHTFLDRSHPFLASEKGIFRVRSVSDQRLCDLSDSVPAVVTILEVADVLVDQARFLIVPIAVLEHLCMLANLDVKLVVLAATLRSAACVFLIPLQFNVDDSLIFLSFALAGEMVDFCRLYNEGVLLILLGVPRRRDGDSVIQVDLLVFFTQTRVDAFDFALGCRAVRDSLLELLSVLHEPLHLLVMDLLLHLFEVILVLLAWLARRCMLLAGLQRNLLHQRFCLLQGGSLDSRCCCGGLVYCAVGERGRWGL